MKREKTSTGGSHRRRRETKDISERGTKKGEIRERVMSQNNRSSEREREKRDAREREIESLTD